MSGIIRHAFIEEQAQDPAININIPDEGESPLGSNESVEEVSQTPNFDAVVFNPIIMDMVFKNIDVKTVKNCRLICKNFNETAIRILSRQNGGYGLAVRLEKGKLKAITTIQLHTLKGLKSIVASSSQHWFSKALLDASFTSLTDIQSVLKDFGYRLRSIEIKGRTFLLRDVHKILVDWCPNLEQLALPPYLDVPDANGQNILDDDDLELVFPRPLNLTSLFMQQEFLISIVKASPKLKTLSCRPDINRPQIFNDLLTCPEVTKNLENLTLSSGINQSSQIQMAEVFNSLQFSSKLKKLALIKVDQDLSEGLEKLGGTLEKLVISLGNKTELIFPGMNNLTELRYITNWRLRINSIEFLTGMPNLTILYVGQSIYPNIGILHEKDFIGHLFSDCQQLRRNPQKKLKELYLFGIVFSPSRTFEMMKIIFPNLTKLVVGLDRNCKDRQKIMKTYYEDVFKGGLSEMLHLKEVYLDFTRYGVDVEENFDYMSIVFGQLNKLSKLTHLTVRDNSNVTTALVGDKLLEIPNFRRLTLIGLKLELLAAKELTMLLYKHDIQLEIKDNQVIEDFRVHVEEQLTFANREIYH